MKLKKRVYYISMVYLMCFISSHSQKFSADLELPHNISEGENYNDCYHPGTKSIKIPVYGLKKLDKVSNILTKIKFKFNGGNGAYNLDNVDLYLRSPKKNCLLIFSGSWGDISPTINESITIELLSSESCLNTFNVSTYSKLREKTLRVGGGNNNFDVDFDLSSEFISEDPNGIWELYINETNSKGAVITEFELYFGEPVALVDVNSEFTISPSNIVYDDMEIHLTSIRNDEELNYSWELGNIPISYDNNVLLELEGYEPGYNTVCLSTALNNCIDSTCKSIKIKKRCNLFIPNIFTPDNDGLNDQFNVEVTCYDQFELLIFDRMGNLLFRSNNPFIAWSGKDSNGIPYPNGVYAYKIKINTSGEVNNHIGMVKILR